MDKFIFISVMILILLLWNKRNKGSLKNPSSWLLMIYFCMSLIAIPVVKLNLVTGETNYLITLTDKYWIGALVFVFFLYLFLIPFCSFRENKIQTFIIPNTKILNRIAFVLILWSLFSILYNLPIAYKLLAYQDLASVRNVISGGGREKFVQAGLLNTIASVGASLYPFAILLFFIYYIIGNNKYKCIILLLCSTSNIVLVLTYLGRDGIVFWMFNFVFFFLLFKDYLSTKQKRAIKKSFIILGIIALTPIITISISRFSKSHAGVGGGTLSYLGQMPPNYLTYYDIAENHYSYGADFPLFFEILGKEKPSRDRWIDKYTESHVFGTFIKNLNSDLGIFGTILLGTALWIFFNSIYGKYKTRFYFYQFFIYIMYWSVMSEGVFYFRQFTRGGNLFFLLCIGLQIYFKIVQKDNKNITLSSETKNNIKENKYISPHFAKRL